MMRLYDLALVVRSKNAGPFTVTIDLVFRHDDEYRHVLESPALTPERIADLYGLESADVSIRPFERIRTIKVSMPRRVSSGAPGDRDVYGSQQHFPLAAMDV
jgi:hypothetical protein